MSSAPLPLLIEYIEDRGRTFSYSASSVLVSCFFRDPTTSSTFFPVTMCSTIPTAFLRTSMSVLVVSTRRMSIARLSRMCSCFARRVSIRSKTMILTLLSDSFCTSSTNAWAAAVEDRNPVRRGRQEKSEGRIPFTAVGFCARVVRIVAASYLTDEDAALRSSKMHRRYLGCRTGVFNMIFPGIVRKKKYPVGSVAFAIPPDHVDNC